ncbi:hypothetical protein [Aquimarina sp. Aq78]|uniref:hypothetical protein n=1 Tax=Aquimarina sp. Aq78 TaxID=1191889 RepID=UPI0018FEBB6B|nr:hypothetical protein [Aquimarina sp. Aq78]
MYENYNRIDTAFYREKQVQDWSRAKKEALMRGELEILPGLSMTYRDKNGASRTSVSDMNKTMTTEP